MSQNIDVTAVKICLLGDSTVGKTAICGAYMDLEFKQDQLSTIGVDKLEKKITLKNGREVKLVLWDTAGQERFRSAAFQYIRNAQGIVLVFDVTNKSTFNSIENWMDEIKDNFKSNPNIILFANKVDLGKEKWQISSEEAREYAKKLNFAYFETSALTKQGLDDGFSYIANEIYNKIKGKEEDNFHLEKPKDEDYEIVNGCFGKKKRLKKKKKNSN